MKIKKVEGNVITIIRNKRKGIKIEEIGQEFDQFSCDGCFFFGKNKKNRCFSGVRDYCCDPLNPCIFKLKTRND